MGLRSADHPSWSGRVSGVAVLPSTVTPANATTYNFCRYDGPPSELTLRLSAYTQTERWGQQGYYAGGQDWSANYAALGTTNVACMIEYGYGSAMNRVMCDWCPGAYRLPVCEFAAVTALFYGTGFTVPDQFFAASLCPGATDKCRMFTRTQRHRAAASGTATLGINHLTRAIEVLAETGQSWTLAGSGVYLARDLATPSLVPSVSPVAVMPLSTDKPTATLTNVLASQQDVTVVEYLDVG